MSSITGLSSLSSLLLAATSSPLSLLSMLLADKIAGESTSLSEPELWSCKLGVERDAATELVESGGVNGEVGEERVGGVRVRLTGEEVSVGGGTGLLLADWLLRPLLLRRFLTSS